MKTKLTCITLYLFFICLVFASSALGAIIMMKDECTSISCIVDEEQLIKIKTSQGEFTLKLNDIMWMAGKDLKRIRQLGKSELLIGKIDKKEIKVKKGEEYLLISPENIIFFYNQNVDLEKVGKIVIKEYEGGTEVELYSQKYEWEHLNVDLVPQNWEGSINISNAIYNKDISQESDTKVTFDVQGDNELYANMNEKSDELTVAFKYFVKTIEGTSSMVSSTEYASMKYVEGVLPKTKDEKTTISINVNKYLFRSVYGRGFAYLYFITKENHSTKGQIEARGEDGNLFIEKTASNILRLPIDIEEY